MIDPPLPRADDAAAVEAPFTSWSAGLQIAGLIAANHLLTSAVAALPGFTDSALHGQLELLREAASGDLLRMGLLVAILPAVVEELLFRGALFGLVRRGGGRGWAVVASAICFAIAHGELHHGLIALGLGLQLGVMREVGGLGLAIAAHASNNAVALAASLLVENAPSAPFGRASDDPFTTVVGLALAAAIAGSAWASARQGWRSTARPADSPRSRLQHAADPDD